MAVATRNAICDIVTFRLNEKGTACKVLAVTVKFVIAVPYKYPAPIQAGVMPAPKSVRSPGVLNREEILVFGKTTPYLYPIIDGDPLPGHQGFG